MKPLKQTKHIPLSESPSEKMQRFSLSLITLVIILGFSIRLFSCFFVSIINPDGPLYIHQARAFHYGLWDQLTSCTLSYLSLYPILIAGAYGIFQDWILAARSVSLLFGTLLLLPIYLLIRKFFDRQISALTILMVSLIPVLVSMSGDVARDPVAWFFTAFGVYFFILQFETDRYVTLSLSSLCYLIAAWNRIEIILFLGVSLLYLLLFQREKKIKSILYFIAPFLILIPFGAIGTGVLNSSITEIFRTPEMIAKLSEPVSSYRNLRAALAVLAHQPDLGILELFFQRARNLVWLIAIATLIVYTLRAFFYPFFFVFILGLPGIGSRMRKDKRLLYLSLLCLFMFVLLYIHLLQTWIIGTRFLVPFMIAASVFLGFGIEKTVQFLHARFKLKADNALVIICFLVLAFGLPKNLSPREHDKFIFKNIGQIIAKREGNHQVIHVATSMRILRWTSFYANLPYRGAPCPQPYSDFNIIVGDDYKSFLKNLKEGHFKYFVWEEKYWPKGTFDFTREMNSRDFEELGRWSHPDTGRLILFKVN